VRGTVRRVGRLRLQMDVCLWGCMSGGFPNTGTKQSFEDKCVPKPEFWEREENAEQGNGVLGTRT